MEIKVDFNNNKTLSWSEIKQKPGMYNVVNASDDFYLMSINGGTILYISSGMISLAREEYWSHRQFQQLTGTLTVKF